MATTYTSDSLRKLFQSSFDLDTWKSLLQNFFKASELKATPEKIMGSTSDNGFYLGNIDTTDSYCIGLFYYQIQNGSVANKRVGLRNLVKSFVNPKWGEFDAALVVFDSGDHWRLSFICDIKGEATSTKRYTYVFGSNELLYKTPIERFLYLQNKGVSFENLKTTFSVEALSDEFFDKYREQYADFIQYITGKRFVKVGSKWEEKLLCEPNETLMKAFGYNGKIIRDYVKKMMGRITFLHFLQRKRWMCGDLNYMQNLFHRSVYQDDYLESVLEPLFFGILNTKPDERNRLFDKYGWDKSLLAEWKDIPYLNGGLFERDEIDETECKFPADYFQRLFHFFSEYNFTIDENDPNDAEVGVDPEMLGKIFENLLEDNKDKGAFYTPKEIVRYMCKESLIAYLESETHLTTCQIRQFVLLPEEGVANILEDQKANLLKALEEVKICDPAIGSGAFPMGLLNELLHCREALCGAHCNHAEIKKSIVQNNIYGVDIEKGAIDIARLRFWLSIVVDEEKPSPLPNLDYKIMQGNSLLESFMGLDLSKLTYEKESKKDTGEISLFDNEKNRLQKTVSHLLTSYFSCADHEKKVKLQQEISNIINQQLQTQLYDPLRLQALKKINIAENDKFFLWHTWFSDVFSRPSKQGFDIVIGNPPYVQMKKGLVPKEQFPYSEGKDTGKQNLYKLFVELSYHIAKENGLITLITQSSLMCDSSAQYTRELLLRKTRMEQVIEFPKIAPHKEGQLFKSALVATCILISQKGIPVSAHTFQISAHNDLTTLYKFDFAKMQQSIPLQFYPNGYCFPLIRGKEFSIIEKMNHNTIFLKKILKFSSQGDFNLTKERHCFSITPTNVKMYRGCHIHRYQIDDKVEEYIQNNYKGDIIRNNKEKTFLVGQNISGMNDKHRFNFTITTNTECLFGHSVDKLELQDGYNAKLILAILNSTLIDWYFRKTSTNNHVNIYELEQLPIPYADSEKQAEIVAIVDMLLMLKQQNPQADTLVEENAINELVYKLYDLSDEEIAIVKRE